MQSPGVLYLIPDIKTGAPTSLGMTDVGSNMGQAAAEFSATQGSSATILNTTGSMASTMDSYQRHREGWNLQHAWP